MRVWVDITNSPHVLFFRPLIRSLQADGHEVSITAREYAQTLELLELHGLAHEVVGPRHGGAGVLGKGRALVGRLPALRRYARLHDFDLALAHGSHELTLTARSLGIPSATAHDYEFATLQHQLGLRAATRVVFPEVIPAARLARLGAKPPKLVRYPGIEEEYYLADFEPDRAVLDGIDAAKVLAVVRTPPDVSLYHRHGTRSSTACSSGSAATSPCTQSCCLGRPSSARRSAAAPSPRCTSRSVRWTPRASSHSPISSSRPVGR